MAANSEKLDNSKGDIFMYGTTENEAKGIIGYPRRWRYTLINHEETVEMMRKMYEEAEEVSVKLSAKEMLAIFERNPEACINAVVSDTDSDEETTYEPSEEQLDQERRARKIWDEKLKQAKNNNEAISFTTKELLTLAEE